MSPVAFLLSAFGICAVGVLLLLLRNRQPSGTTHGVRSFEREMRALDPKRNKVRHDPFGRPHDELIDLREERISSGVTIVEPVTSSTTVKPIPATGSAPTPTPAPAAARIHTPSVVVVRAPEPDAPPADEASSASAEEPSAIAEVASTSAEAGQVSTGDGGDDVPRTDPGEADGPRDEARG